KWHGVGSYNWGTNAWSFDSSGIDFKPQCFYIAKTSAVDNASNSESSFGSRRFKFTPPPAITGITVPLNLKYYKNLTVINGTANGDTQKLALEIRRLSDDYYWNFDTSGWQSAEVSTGSIFPSGGTWIYDISLPGFINYSSYTMRSIGTNLSNVDEAAPVTIQVFFDTTEPNAAVDIPDAASLYYNSMDILGGTAVDPPQASPPAAGIYKSRARIKDNNGEFAGKFWDNETSTFTLTWNQTGNESVYYVAGSSWEYTVSYPTSTFINGAQYEIKANASDLTYNNSILEGNESSLTAGNVFNYDISIPTATVACAYAAQARSDVQIASGTILETMVIANETQEPGMQIDSIKLHIKDNVLGQYWTGSSWDSDSSVSTNSIVHQSSWSTAAISPWVDEGSYTMWAEAIDKAGNIQ
ncbi:MAG: hypothetical protein KAI33_04690, partial [Elusimicrobiales bacterium]|nr:hypothetical protein [Elusimicrobiales bacterium]